MDIMFVVTVGESNMDEYGKRRWDVRAITKTGMVTSRALDAYAIDEAVKQFERTLRQAVVDNA
jgi:hypothetical protein